MRLGMSIFLSYRIHGKETNSPTLPAVSRQSWTYAIADGRETAGGFTPVDAARSKLAFDDACMCRVAKGQQRRANCLGVACDPAPHAQFMRRQAAHPCWTEIVVYVGELHAQRARVAASHEAVNVIPMTFTAARVARQAPRA